MWNTSCPLVTWSRRFTNIYIIGNDYFGKINCMDQVLNNVYDLIKRFVPSNLLLNLTNWSLETRKSNKFIRNNNWWSKIFVAIGLFLFVSFLFWTLFGRLLSYNSYLCDTHTIWCWKLRDNFIRNVHFWLIFVGNFHLNFSPWRRTRHPWHIYLAGIVWMWTFHWWN